MSKVDQSILDLLMNADRKLRSDEIAARLGRDFGSVSTRVSKMYLYGQLDRMRVNNYPIQYVYGLKGSAV